MKGRSTWSYAPYKPFFWEVGDIYICRIVPYPNSIRIEWLPAGKEEYSVYFRLRGEDEFKLCGTAKGTEYLITGLTEGSDYEFYVCAGEEKSRIRLARCGAHVGTAVNYLHPEDNAYDYSGKYLCSPSLIDHPDGYLLASMDLYCGNAPQNLTLIYRSDDGGKSWHYVSELMPCFWGKMFLHKGSLYMLACSTEYGDLLIGRSDDGGKTFGAPVTLLRGSNGKNGNVGVHKNPQNIFRHNGRIYETLEWGSWKNTEYYHAAMVMSCKEDDDLLDPESWHFTPPVKHDLTWKGAASDGEKGNIEGTLCLAPNGELYNLMRYQTKEKKILAYRVNTADPDMPLEYSHAVDFPCNLSKFTVKYDKESNCYYSIASRRIDEPKTGRNLLSLMVSRDMVNWSVAADLIDRRNEDPKLIGFQYVDFEFKGDDIIFLCRTAMNGAHTFHDSNYLTFHTIENFRKYSV